MLSSHTHRRPIVSSIVGVAAVLLAVAVSATWNVTAWWRHGSTPLDQWALSGAAVMAELLALVAMTLALHHASQRRWMAAFMAGVLLAGCIGWNVTGGLLYQEQVARTHIAQQGAPALERAQARLAEVERRISALPELPADAPGRRIEARNAQFTALAAERDAASAALRELETAPAAASVMTPLMWAKVILLELVKAFGLWACSVGARAAPAAKVERASDRLVSRKRSEAARKGAATRRRNAEKKRLSAVANDNDNVVPLRR